MRLKISVMKVELLTPQDCEKPVIKKVIEELNRVRDEAAMSGDEEKANGCWRELEATELNILYIGAFHKIKNKEYRDAWCDLEKCEIKYSSLEENSSEEFLINSRSKFIFDKVKKLQSLYPYSVFASPGFTVGFYTCSICDHKIRPRSRCEHKKGKVYNGELCLHVGHDMKFTEISLVTNPVQKYSVVHNDETLDFSLLTYLLDILDNAFEEWDLHWTTMKFAINRFSNVKPDSKCPCKSDNIFEECCIGKDEVEIPHIDFIFSKPIPEEKEEIAFPY